MSPSPISIESGVDIERSDQAQQFPVHMEVACDEGVYAYVQAGAALTKGKAVTPDVANGIGAVKPTTAGTDLFYGVAQTNVAANEFGWVGIRGVVRGDVPAGAAGATVAGGAAGAIAAGTATGKTVTLLDAGAAGGGIRMLIV